MEPLTTIFVFLVVVVTCQTNAYSKPEIFNHGDNATVLIETLPTNGKKSLEIFFSGFTKKLHVVHMIIMGPNTNNEDDIQVSRHYSGRIKDINMNNDSITFILLNVNLMDSGHYTVFEGSLEKGKRSILVTSRILTGQVSKPMILPFMCNNTNTSSIKIGKSHAFHYLDNIIYDVARKSCTYANVTLDYMDRIDSCVLNDTNFNLILRELTWRDKGAYTAWDDQGLLLDVLFVCIIDKDTSFPQGTHSLDSSSHKVENDKLLWPLVSSVVVVLVAAFLVIVTVRKLRQNKGKLMLLWLLVSTAANVLVLACLAIIAVRKLRHRKDRKKTKEEEITCSDHGLRMFQATNTALQSGGDDERKYEDPRSNAMELTAVLEPISQPVNVYERLNPYENQGNNMYRSLRPENII